MHSLPKNEVTANTHQVMTSFELASKKHNTNGYLISDFYYKSIVHSSLKCKSRPQLQYLLKYRARQTKHRVTFTQLHYLHTKSISSGWLNYKGQSHLWCSCRYTLHLYPNRFLLYTDTKKPLP